MDRLRINAKRVGVVVQMRWAYEEGIEYDKSAPDEQLCGFLELPWHVFKEVIEKLYVGRIPPTRRHREGLDGEHIFLIHSPYPLQQ